jgi:hypothetical protein
MSQVSATKHCRLVFLRSRLFQEELGTCVDAESVLTRQNVHKQIHKRYQTFDPFVNSKGFKYTGTLRACYPEIAVPKRSIPKQIVLPDHAETGIPIQERTTRFSNKIEMLTQTEIKGMRKVCKVRTLTQWRTLTKCSWQEKYWILLRRHYVLESRPWNWIEYVMKRACSEIRIPRR